QMDGTGTADTQTVEIISGANTSETFDFTLNIQANDADAADVNDAEVESVTIIDSDTENNIVDIDSGAEHTDTLTLTGGRANDTFTVTAPAGLETVTINAAGQLSDVTITVGTEDQTITMGSGDDEVTFEAVDDLDNNDTLDGGDGTDTLIAGISADHTDELNSTNFEILKIDADASHVFDITDSDEITTVVLMSDANDDAIATAVTAGVIDLEADSISTIRIEANSADGGGAEVANGLDLSTDNTGASMAIETTDSGDDSLTIGVITLDDDVTTITVSNADDDDNAQTVFNEISAVGLTALTITDGYDLSDANSQETVIDLDDTAALTSIDASAALGGVNLDIDDLGASATINLVQADDVADDAADALTIAITGGTTADNLTINDGGAASSVTITSGDFDGLTINMGGGNDTVTLTGAVGDGTTVNGDAGNDILIGHNDDDVINGGAGNDYIRGGTGTDTLSGGAGDDNFVFHSASSNSDTIDDWTAADDVIVFGADEATNAADVFDAGAVVLAGTDPDAGTDTAATDGTETITALAAADYAEVTAATGTLDDNHVTVVDIAAGYADLEALYDAFDGGGDGGGSNESHIIIFMNSTSNDVEMWYVSDTGTDTDRSDIVASQLASFDNITGADIGDAFAATNFAVGLIA
ncbi:hypothetical protein N8Z18_00865, partial [bacterium]|nr:hypothetical protein [bacterium]